MADPVFIERPARQSALPAPHLQGEDSAAIRWQGDSRCPTGKWGEGHVVSAAATVESRPRRGSLYE